jgi:hypothetical protein
VMELCQQCPVAGLGITEDQLVAGWETLVLKPDTREKLASDLYTAFDSDEARSSLDPAIRKTVTGRAIAQCLTRTCVDYECPLSEVHMYAATDDPNLFPTNN